MKKIICIVLGLTIILSNISGFLFINNAQFTKYLFSKNSLTFDYSQATREITNEKLKEMLIAFSAEHNIDILKYEFLSETELNIYSTNIQNDKEIKLKSGKLPEKNYFISNRETPDHKQIGIFYFPLTNWTIHMYDFQQVNNVGLGNKFYFNKTDNEEMKVFIKKFSDYGEITTGDEQISSLKIINISLLTMVLLSFVICSIGILLYSIANRRKLLLSELWGCSKIKTCFSISKSFISFISILVVIQFICLLWVLRSTEGFSSIEHYLVAYFILNAGIIILLLLVSFASMNLALLFKTYALNMKGKLFFNKVRWLAAMLKILVTILLFNAIHVTFSDLTVMKDKMESLAAWNQSKNVFKIRYTKLDDRVDSDLKLDRELNNRLTKFYEELEEKKGAFLIDSTRFHVVGFEKEEPIYMYEMNLKEEKEKYNYSPYGNKITINTNYLKYNPIVDKEHESALSRIVYDENVINLLVPEQFQGLEKKIKQAYRDYFYFHKIEIENMYNQEIGLPLNNQSIDTLLINIIYTKSGQKYFTYNGMTGDAKNQIKDPIAIVYTKGWDTSYIGALVTSSLFIEQQSKNDVYDEMKAIITDANVPEIQQVLSVYGEANEQIVEAKEKLFQQTIVLIIVILFSLGILIVSIWSYYSMEIYKIGVMYLFGYSYWRSNKWLISVIVFSNFFIALLSCIIYRNFISIVMLTVTIICELIILKIFGDYLRKKRICEILKGEYK